MELTFKDSMMFYHTALRNVGLYTSISLALLGYSRFYRGKGNALYNISFIVISMITLFLAISILTNLKQNMMAFQENLEGEQKEIVSNWMMIPEYLYYTLFIVFAFSVFTLYREVFQQKRR